MAIGQGVDWSMGKEGAKDRHGDAETRRGWRRSFLLPAVPGSLFAAICQLPFEALLACRVGDAFV